MLTYDELRMIELLENNKLRMSDCASKLNLNQIKAINLMNKLKSKGYISVEEIQTSEFYVEDYYFLNSKKLHEVHEVIENLDIEQKKKYILNETTRIFTTICREEKIKDSRVQLSTISVSNEEFDKISEKVKELCEYVKNCEEVNNGTKISISVLFSHRPEL